MASSKFILLTVFLVVAVSGLPRNVKKRPTGNATSIPNDKQNRKTKDSGFLTFSRGLCESKTNNAKNVLEKLAKKFNSKTRGIDDAVDTLTNLNHANNDIGDGWIPQSGTIYGNAFLAFLDAILCSDSEVDDTDIDIKGMKPKYCNDKKYGSMSEILERYNLRNGLEDFQKLRQCYNEGKDFESETAALAWKLMEETLEIITKKVDNHWTKEEVRIILLSPINVQATYGTAYGGEKLGCSMVDEFYKHFSPVARIFQLKDEMESSKTSIKNKLSKCLAYDFDGVIIIGTGTETSAITTRTKRDGKSEVTSKNHRDTESITKEEEKKHKNNHKEESSATLKDKKHKHKEIEENNGHEKFEKDKKEKHRNISEHNEQNINNVGQIDKVGKGKPETGHKSPKKEDNKHKRTKKVEENNGDIKSTHQKISDESGDNKQNSNKANKNGKTKKNEEINGHKKSKQSNGNKEEQRNISEHNEQNINNVGQIDKVGKGKPETGHKSPKKEDNKHKRTKKVEENNGDIKSTHQKISDESGDNKQNSNNANKNGKTKKNEEINGHKKSKQSNGNKEEQRNISEHNEQNNNNVGQIDKVGKGKPETGHKSPKKEDNKHKRTKKVEENNGDIKSTHQKISDESGDNKQNSNNANKNGKTKKNEEINGHKKSKQSNGNKEEQRNISEHNEQNNNNVGQIDKVGKGKPETGHKSPKKEDNKHKRTKKVEENNGDIKSTHQKISDESGDNKQNSNNANKNGKTKKNEEINGHKKSKQSSGNKEEQRNISEHNEQNINDVRKIKKVGKGKPETGHKSELQNKDGKKYGESSGSSQSERSRNDNVNTDRVQKPGVIYEETTTQSTDSQVDEHDNSKDSSDKCDDDDSDNDSQSRDNEEDRKSELKKKDSETDEKRNSGSNSDNVDGDGDSDCSPEQNGDESQQAVGKTVIKKEQDVSESESNTGSVTSISNLEKDNNGGYKLEQGIKSEQEGSHHEQRDAQGVKVEQNEHRTSATNVENHQDESSQMARSEAELHTVVQDDDYRETLDVEKSDSTSSKADDQSKHYDKVTKDENGLTEVRKDSETSSYSNVKTNNYKSSSTYDGADNKDDKDLFDSGEE